ncbi:hypothetical protein Bca4012_058827 [Brassica carinata]
MENIGYGKEGATVREIEAAAKLANAAKFIDKLPPGLETMVGEHGTQLSGGQKQRIAIAKAIIKDPRILLLDEATSALDAESERVVQEALDRVMVNWTTVIVAHRLSTVRNADMIAVLHRGKIVEEGAYSQLIRIQDINTESKRLEISNGQQNGSSRNGSSKGNSSSRMHDDDNESVSVLGLLAGQENTEMPKDMPHHVSITRIAALNKLEALILVLGTLVCALDGAIFPIFGLLFAKVIIAFFQPPHELRSDLRFWSIVFVLLGVLSLVVYPMHMSLFAVAGGRLIRRIRSMCFEKVVHMEVGWFDEPEKSSGAMGARLSADAALIRTLVGDSLALTVNNVASAVAGIIIAFVISWELAVIILVMIPLTGINNYVQVKFMKGFSANAETKYEEASQVANDAVGSIRTVASFCAEEKVIDMYKKQCEDSIKSGMKQGLVAGLGFGRSFFVLYSVYAVCFYAGARLVKDGRTTYNGVFSDSIVNVEKEDAVEEEEEEHKNSDSVGDVAGGDGDGYGGGECSSEKVKLPEELAKGVVILTCESNGESGSCDVYLIGTAHVSKFDKFDNTSEALEVVAKLLEGAPRKGLRKFLKANCEGETLAVADSKLGNIIKEKLVCNAAKPDFSEELSMAAILCLR